MRTRCKHPKLFCLFENRLGGTRIGRERMLKLKVRESNDPEFGYNADTEKFENLVKAGVIDPTKVTRLALQNAGSVAALMLTTEALISEIPEEDKGSKMPPMPPGGGGMY